MMPLASEFLQRVGRNYWQLIATLSIYGFFYGASSSLAAWGSSTSLISGVFIVLFSGWVLILMFVFVFQKAAYLSASPKLDRRRGFSNRATRVMFVATVINFLLSSLYTGSQVAAFIVPIRKALILNVDYPLSEKPELINNALRNVRIIFYWTVSLSVSIKLSLPDHYHSCFVEVLLSDLVIIWRALALFPDRQWVILMPFILWIAALGE